MAAYVLYGSEVSLFSGKARAYLRWRGADFEERPATREVYQNVILPKVGWPVVPVVEMAGGAVVQDTTDIIETVEAQTPDGPRAIPDGPVQGVVSRLLDLFADEWLVIPAMHYRWNYNEDWTYGEFGRMSAPDAPPAEQYAIGKKNGERFKGAVPMLGVSEDTIPGVEAAYEAFLKDMTEHLRHHAYVLGGRASLGDFALNGPLYAHLLRGFGRVEFETGGFEGECAARSFPLWRLQAVTDAIDAMDDDAKARLADLLDRVGGSPLMDFRLPARLARRDCRLKLA